MADLAELLDKLPRIPIPGLGSSDTIGIDLGSSLIKIVQIKGTPGKYELVRWSVIPLVGAEEGEKELAPEEKKAKAMSSLKNYRGSGKGIPKNAVTSVSGNAVIVRYVKFQKLTRKELSKTIKAEAEPYIPFNVEEVFIGYHPIKDVMDEGKQKMETVLVAAKQDLVNQRVEILEGGGFKAMIMDVDAFALESVYESMQQGPSEETVLMVNIGASQSNFAILEKGVSMVVKDSPVSGNSITKAVMKNMGVDLKTAEKLKIQNGLLVTPQEKEAALSAGNKEALGVSNAVTSVLKDLASEMKKLIEFYSMQGQDRQVSRVLISGGSANIKNGLAYFQKELNMNVERLNPFAKIAAAEGVPEEYHATLAVAAGLAMRRVGDIKE